MIGVLGALLLSGGLMSAGPVSASASAGGVTEFPIPSMKVAAQQIVAGPEGDLWFTEQSTGSEVGKIGRMTPEGAVIQQIEVPDTDSEKLPASKELPGYSEPLAIARGPGGSIWFTDNGENSEEERFVWRITLSKGTPELKAFPIKTKHASLASIVEGPDGNMWFTEEYTPEGGKIGQMTPEGKVMAEFKIPATEALPSSTTEPVESFPGGLAQGPGGLWFTDDGSNSENQNFIGRITTSGKINEFPIPIAESQPVAIAAGSNGDMWFTEGKKMIGQITPTGEIKEFPVSGTSYSAEAIAPGPDGNMWFTDATTNAIGRITPTGEVKEFPIPTVESNPGAIAAGLEGNMWFTEIEYGLEVKARIGRLTTPFTPTNVSPPAISGTPTQGQALSASQGSWTNGPGAFAYQWQDCDTSGNNCSNLSGETGVTHYLTPGDVGHTLRVVVSAGNIAGSASAVSAPTAVVVAPPPPPPPPAAKPRVESSMTWTFGWSRKYTIVESLFVHGAPAGSHVEVVCRGHGCPFAHHHTATVASHGSCHGSKCKSKSKSKSKSPAHIRPEINLTGLFKGRHLAVGASISVNVVKSGWIGKSFVFTVRPGRAPHVQIDCLAPGSTSHPGRGC
jgi:virginiamycin B lyase